MIGHRPPSVHTFPRAAPNYLHDEPGDLVESCVGRSGVPIGTLNPLLFTYVGAMDSLAWLALAVALRHGRATADRALVNAFGTPWHWNLIPYLRAKLPAGIVDTPYVVLAMDGTVLCGHRKHEAPCAVLLANQWRSTLAAPIVPEVRHAD